MAIVVAAQSRKSEDSRLPQTLLSSPSRPIGKCRLQRVRPRHWQPKTHRRRFRQTVGQQIEGGERHPNSDPRPRLELRESQPQSRCAVWFHVPRTSLCIHHHPCLDVDRSAQIRQLFRLALEGMFFWVRRTLIDGARSTAELVDLFWEDSNSVETDTTTNWLSARANAGDPVELLEALITSLRGQSSTNLEETIADAIALTLRESIAGLDVSEREDRLPLDRACREAGVWGGRPPKEFIRHILESWVLAQHVYWSVGRGLADARARGKSILRLKIILDEGGWTLTPGASLGSPPEPAGDRLETVLNLAKESALV